jgi:hypothetical protein
MSAIKSAYSIHSTAFAHWFISTNKSHILPEEFEELVEKLNSGSIWEEFMASDDYNSIVKSAVDLLIPELVETKKGKKGVKPPGNSNSPSDVIVPPTKKRSTKKIVESVGESDAVEVPAVAKKRGPKPKNPVDESTSSPKKRGPKQTNSIPTTVADVVEEPVSISQLSDISDNDSVHTKIAVGEMAPEKKKRQYKKKITAPAPAPEPEVEPAPEPEPEKAEEPKESKEKKSKKSEKDTEEPKESKEKKSKKSKKDTEEPKETKEKKSKKSKKDTEEPKETKEKKSKKSKKDAEELPLEPVEKKKKNQVVAEDDVVTPSSEQDQLELSFQNMKIDELNEEESFEDEADGIEVTERFIGDVLYYVDDSDNWYDLSYASIEKPVNA